MILFNELESCSFQILGVFFLLSSFANLRIYPHGLVLVDVQSYDGVKREEEMEQVDMPIKLINYFKKSRNFINWIVYFIRLNIQPFSFTSMMADLAIMVSWLKCLIEYEKIVLSTILSTFRGDIHK